MSYTTRSAFTIYFILPYTSHSFYSLSGQLVGYTYEEAGIRVCSMLDEELPIIEIPTPVRILF